MKNPQSSPVTDKAEDLGALASVPETSSAANIHLLKQIREQETEPRALL